MFLQQSKHTKKYSTNLSQNYDSKQPKSGQLLIPVTVANNRPSLSVLISRNKVSATYGPSTSTTEMKVKLTKSPYPLYADCMAMTIKPAMMTGTG